MTIYLDSLLLLNFLVNYLVLLSTAKVSGQSFKRLRLALGAMLGGVYALSALFPAAYFMSGPLGKAVVCFLMVITAFGLGKRTFRLCLITFGVSFAFAGAAMLISLAGGNLLANVSAMYVPIDMKTLVLVTGASYFLLSAVFRKTASFRNRGVGEVKITAFGKTISLSCLEDTGNSLVDPMTNEPVTVANMDVLKRLAGVSLSGKDASKLFQDVAILCPTAKPRLIPYKSVGTSGGLLLAIKCDSVSYNGRTIKGGLVAFSPNELSCDGSYSAICAAIGG